MKHPDPQYRKVGELEHFWVKLLVGKILLVSSSVALFICGADLQKSDRIGAVGVLVILAFAVAGFIALFVWDFWPSRRCPECHDKMKRCRIRPENPSPASEEAMVLSCDRCKTYVDLNVSME